MEQGYFQIPYYFKNKFLIDFNSKSFNFKQNCTNFCNLKLLKLQNSGRCSILKVVIQ